MTERLVFLGCVALTVAGACRRPPVARAVATATGTASPVSLPQDGALVARASPNVETAAATATSASVVVAEPENADDELRSEEREANPTSETVTLKLTISPPVKASVMWGAKQVARVTPDKPVVELQRPRSSGPLDLEIRAEGFLPHHTRLYSDRNDRVSIRLVRPGDASALLGFRSSVSAAAAKVRTR